MTSRPKSIAKVLSPNDTGSSGSHQAGILVPRKSDILSFFPELSSGTKNPRAQIPFVDSCGTRWTFTFIYYNNKFFDPSGTRNEYRLTGMTRFLRECGAEPGDKIVFKRDENDCYGVELERQRKLASNLSIDSVGRVHISISPANSWKIVEM